MVELPLGQLARQVCELANRTVRKYIVDLLLISVQVLFFFLKAIQLYELCAIKPKGGFYKHVVVLLSEKRIRKYSILVKRKLL